MASHSVTTTFELAPGIELEVEGTAYEGIPEQGPSFSSAGEPGEPPYAQIDRILLDGGEVDLDGLFYCRSVDYGRVLKPYCVLHDIEKALLLAAGDEQYERLASRHAF
jgi:hypothetical protein